MQQNFVSILWPGYCLLDILSVTFSPWDVCTGPEDQSAWQILLLPPARCPADQGRGHPQCTCQLCPNQYGHSWNKKKMHTAKFLFLFLKQYFFAYSAMRSCSSNQRYFSCFPYCLENWKSSLKIFCNLAVLNWTGFFTRTMIKKLYFITSSPKILTPPLNFCSKFSPFDVFSVLHTASRE